MQLWLFVYSALYVIRTFMNGSMGNNKYLNELQALRMTTTDDRKYDLKEMYLTKWNTYWFTIKI